MEPGLDWHYSHNLTLLGLTYEYLGETKLAEASLRKAFALPAYADLQEFNRKAWPEFLLAQGRLPEALAASRDIANSRYGLGKVAGHTAAGRVLLAQGEMAKAESELAVAEQELQALNNPGPFVPYVEALRGELLLKQGKADEAAALFHKIEPALRASAGPDAWTETLFWLETIFNAARGAGAWELAEFTSQQLALQDANYGGTHYALALVAEHRGDADAARRELQAAEHAWGQADADFHELAGVRQKLGGTQ